MFVDNIGMNSVVQLGATLLSSIDGSEFDGDYGILTATRLLLYPRLKEGETHGTSFAYFHVSEGLDAMNDSIEAIPNNGWSKLYVLCDDIPRRVFRERAAQINPEGFEAPELINTFAREKFNGRILINEETRTTIVLLSNVTSMKQHMICAILPVLLPWCHFDDKPLNDLEFKYLESFLGDELEDYNLAYLELYRSLDLEKYILRNTMKKLNDSMRKKKEERLTNDIDSCRNEINSLMAKINIIQNQMNAFTDELFGALNRMDKDPTEEMMKFLERTENIKLESVDDNGNIKVFVSGDLVNYPNAIGVLVNNTNSVVYEFRTAPALEDVKKLLLAIFDTQELTVRLGSYFKVNPFEGRVISCGGSDLETIKQQNCLPNPHLYHFNCLGGNSMAIAQKMRNGDIVGALMQCQAAVSSLNLRENPSFRYFINDLLTIKTKCIRLPDGQYVDAERAIEYLNQKENNDE